jgi:hypothetical protein
MENDKMATIPMNEFAPFVAPAPTLPQVAWTTAPTPSQTRRSVRTDLAAYDERGRLVA